MSFSGLVHPKLKSRYDLLTSVEHKKGRFIGCHFLKMKVNGDRDGSLKKQ